MQRLLDDRDIYVKPTEHGFTVVTMPSSLHQRTAAPWQGHGSWSSKAVSTPEGD
jgi:hypothetical protein